MWSFSLFIFLRGWRGKEINIIYVHDFFLFNIIKYNINICIRTHIFLKFNLHVRSYKMTTKSFISHLKEVTYTSYSQEKCLVTRSIQIKKIYHL